MAILEGAPQNNIHQNSPAAQVEGPVISRGRLAVPYLLTDDQVLLAKASALPYLSDDRVSGLLISTPDQSFVQVRIDRPAEGTPAYAECQELLVGYRDLTQRVLSLEHILSRPGSRKDVVEAKLAVTKRALSDVQAKLGSNITLINPDGRPYIPDQIPQPFGGVQEVALPPPIATPRSRGRGAAGHAGTIVDKRVQPKVEVKNKHVLRNTIAVGMMMFGALTAAIAPTAADIADAIMQPPAPPKPEPAKSVPAIVLPTSTTTPPPTIIPIYTTTPSPIPTTAASEAITPIPSVVPATSTPDINEGTAEDMRPYEVVKQTIGPTTITNETNTYVTYPQTDKMIASGPFEVRFKLDVKSPGTDTAGANPKNTVTLNLNKGRVYLAKNASSYVMAVVGPNQVINRVVIGSDKNFPKGEFAFRFLEASQTAQVIVDGKVVGALDISAINLFNPDGQFTLGVEAAPKAEDIFSATIAVPKGQENNVKPFVQTPVPPKTTPQVLPTVDIQEALNDKISQLNKVAPSTFYNVDLTHRSNTGGIGFNTIHGSFWFLSPDNSLYQLEGTSIDTANALGVATDVSKPFLGSNGRLYQIFTMKTGENGHTAKIRVDLASTKLLIRDNRPATIFNGETKRYETIKFDGPYFVGTGIRTDLLKAGMGMAIAIQERSNKVFLTNLFSVDSNTVLDYPADGFITINN